jgi:hypothetical protein
MTSTSRLGRPLTAVEQRAAEEAIRRAPKNLWRRANTPTAQPYPCLCSRARACNPRFCACAGRLDLDQVPERCCAHTNTPEVAALAQLKPTVGSAR